eukprot:1248294-Rhodomonas_salina.2
MGVWLRARRLRPFSQPPSRSRAHTALTRILLYMFLVANSWRIISGPLMPPRVAVGNPRFQTLVCVV